jgi:short-subunit dehydrogenase
MARDLSDQTVFIAGASSGMGRATALASARAGASLILLGRHEAGLDETAASARAVGQQARIATVVADASNADALADAVSEIDLSTVDVLINSVGTNIVERAFDQLTAASWESMLQVNLMAAFNLCKLFVPPMRARSFGRSLPGFEGRRARPEPRHHGGGVGKRHPCDRNPAWHDRYAFA